MGQDPAFVNPTLVAITTNNTSVIYSLQKLVHPVSQSQNLLFMKNLEGGGRKVTNTEPAKGVLLIDVVNDGSRREWRKRI